MSMLWEETDRSLSEQLCSYAISIAAGIIVTCMITIWICVAMCAVIFTSNVIAGNL